MFLMFLFIFISSSLLFFFFFFNDTATTEIYTLSLHDALPIYFRSLRGVSRIKMRPEFPPAAVDIKELRSEEHTSELQSHSDLVCRLLLEKKKKKKNKQNITNNKMKKHTYSK